MPVKKGASLDPERTRRQVLNTASWLFYERGTHPVGVNEIADAAGVSKLTIYRHFDSKEGLIRAFLEAHSEATLAAMREVAAAQELEPRERILAVFDTLAGTFEKPGYRGCGLMNTAAEWRGSESDVGELARLHVGRMRELLVELCAEADVPSPDAVADQLLVLIQGAIALRMTRANDGAAGVARGAAEALLAGAAGRS